MSARHVGRVWLDGIVINRNANVVMFVMQRKMVGIEGSRQSRNERLDVSVISGHEFPELSLDLTS